MTRGSGVSFGGALNIPALLGGANATAEFVSNVAGESATLENFFYVNSLVPPPATPVLTTTAAGINLQFSNTYLGENSSANFGGPVEIRIYRGTSPGQASATRVFLETD